LAAVILGLCALPPKLCVGRDRSRRSSPGLHLPPSGLDGLASTLHSNGFVSAVWSHRVAMSRRGRESPAGSATLTTL
jgi:hypothetical protein